MLWVWIPIRAKCTTSCDKVCQWLATSQWFPPPIKTDCHDITEILLNVALNTIKQTNKLRKNTIHKLFLGIHRCLCKFHFKEHVFNRFRQMLKNPLLFQKKIKTDITYRLINNYIPAQFFVLLTNCSYSVKFFWNSISVVFIKTYM